VSFLAALRDAVRPNGDRAPGCEPCAHFCDDPADLERELPGLAALSSGHASVRAQDGLCLRHDLLINGRRRCHAFTERDRSPLG